MGVWEDIHTAHEYAHDRACAHGGIEVCILPRSHFEKRVFLTAWLENSNAGISWEDGRIGRAIMTSSGYSSPALPADRRCTLPEFQA